MVKYLKIVIPAKAGHKVKLQRYPEKHWMPDQVRHDGVWLFNRRVNNYTIDTTVRLKSICQFVLTGMLNTFAKNSPSCTSFAITVRAAFYLIFLVISECYKLTYMNITKACILLPNLYVAHYHLEAQNTIM